LSRDIPPRPTGKIHIGNPGTQRNVQTGRDKTPKLSNRPGPNAKKQALCRYIGTNPFRHCSARTYFWSISFRYNVTYRQNRTDSLTWYEFRNSYFQFRTEMVSEFFWPVSPWDSKQARGLLTIHAKHSKGGSMLFFCRSTIKYSTKERIL